MKNSSLITILRSFNKKEHREFTKWLASPFFNQRKDVVDLYTYLVDANHIEHEKFLDKKRIYKKLFPKTLYDDAKFRQTAHFLLKQVEQYLSYSEIKEDTYSYPVAYLKTLRKRKIDRVFESKMKSLRKQGLGGVRLDGKSLDHSFDMLFEHYGLMLDMNKPKNSYLEEIIEALDIKIMLEKLKCACLEFSHNKIFKTNYKGKFIDEILITIENNPSLLKYSALSIYYYGYKIQLPGKAHNEDYFNLTKTIAQNASLFSASEQRSFYLMAINYCIEQINKGDSNFIRELFNIYKEGLKKNTFIENGVLSTVTYSNISSAALRLKEYEWIEEYVEKYTPYLEEQYRENFKDYTLAKLSFEQGKYADAMQMLFHFESKHLLLTLNAKTLLLKIYYEEDEIDALESLLDSMRIYLKRKEIIGYHKINYQNIIKYTRKLFRLNPYDKEKRKLLREEILTTSPITERPWLLEQIDKL